MAVLTEPNSANVFAGQVEIYIAAFGTALPLGTGGTNFPFFTAKPIASDWTAAGFRRVGYTENGFDLVSTPSTKDFTPDELITPVLTQITGIKLEAKFTLWEATMENMKVALALSSFYNPGSGVKGIGVGSGGTLAEYVVACQGASPNGPRDRVTVINRANVISPSTISYSRKDIAKLPVTVNGLSDSSKDVTVDVWFAEEFEAGS